MGTQILQRAVVELDEIYALLGQEASARDVAAKEANELARYSGSNKDGLLYGERERWQREQGLWTAADRLASDLQARWSALGAGDPQSIGFTSAAIDRSLYSDRILQAGVMNSAGTHEAGYSTAFVSAETNRLVAKQAATDAQDLNSRSDNLKSRVEEDLKRALNCLGPASDGLVLLLRYPDALNTKLSVGNSTTESMTTVNAFVAWTRKANAWFAALVENDQQFTYSLSLRSRLGEAAFIKAIDARHDVMAGSLAKVQSSFEVPLFYNELRHRLLRVRGVSLYVESTKSEYQYWAATLTAPSRASSTAMDGEPFAVGQEVLPTVTIGRTFRRSVALPADVVGTVSLGNACPVSLDVSSPWRLVLQCDKAFEAQFEAISNIEIELHLTGQSFGD